MSRKKIIQIIRNSKQKISYWLACHFWGYCPTSKEMQNAEIKKLAERLQGRSKEETLTNILEWQDRNVFFWDERHPISTILGYSVLLFFPLFFVLGYYWTLVLSIYFKTWLMPDFLILGFSAFVTCSITIIVVIYCLLRLNRKIPIKTGFYNALKPSISINMLLRHGRKLGICRDYAKLSACLLSNIDKDAEIYFLHSGGHVATGIKIEKEIYMLDQHLPLLRIIQWIRREHGVIDPSKIHFPYKTAHKLINSKLESVRVDSLFSKSDTILSSPRELARQMTQLLDKQKNETGDSKDEFVSVKLPRWKAGANLFEFNDKIVNYSLSLWLKTKISNELIDLEQITKIEAEKDDEDLIFQITFRLKDTSPDNEAR